MTEPADLFAGDRVVVRYRLGEATPADWRGDRDAARSDVTGFLVDDADPLVLERDGTRESIPRSAVTSVRLLSAKPVRNSEIRNLEHAAALAWPGVESAWIDGWLLRAGGGFTRRANSALPLEPSARSAQSLPQIAAWYRRRDLPVLLSLPDRLMTAGVIDGERGVEVQVLTADLETLLARGASMPNLEIRLDDEPSDQWLHAYRPDADVELARRVTTAARGPVRFATIGTDDISAIGRAAVTAGPDGVARLSLTALWTAPDRRRSGLAGAVARRLVEWGAAEGAASAYVQVETTNRVAGAWYRRWGFALHHTAHYLTPTIEGNAI
ncbi:GNAT family N-acetyltransferase [Gordonia sp. NPDC003585]|uniref:N-acetylglutamate synthase, CG3035 family n=1 Tax=Gordonia sp. NPDC003585 TaxID=3154275 RepID=UPI0033A792C2